MCGQKVEVCQRLKFARSETGSDPIISTSYRLIIFRTGRKYYKFGSTNSRFLSGSLENPQINPTTTLADYFQHNFIVKKMFLAPSLRLIASLATGHHRYSFKDAFHCGENPKLSFFSHQLTAVSLFTTTLKTLFCGRFAVLHSRKNPKEISPQKGTSWLPKGFLQAPSRRTVHFCNSC